ncbi:MAG: CPBP family intramembrane metalloprotease [Acidimicrobiales bacterium]|nr:CPBP family intramembrane metalloprotease [Acidimicrobiales bacterium]MDP6297979.1 CPBP family intramembrane metalloprotease [Acidimicrobiales bacterium]HJM29000.1 CPBP family intramembrane glutamic endopeptidase [Acidimicrobiales bacterium]HJM98416.1 CPBP family intramembrane glutamic endopeptidase [Acidimicrobiales bacterium]
MESALVESVANDMLRLSYYSEGCSGRTIGYYLHVTDAHKDGNVQRDRLWSFPSAGKIENDWRKWGFAQVIIGYALSLVASLLGLTIVYGVTNYQNWDDLPMWAVSLVGFPQQFVLGLTVVFAASKFGGDLKRDFLLQMGKNDMRLGLLSGVAAQLILVPLVTYPFVWLFDVDVDRISEPARNLSDRATSPFGVVALIITVGILAPLVEELFFRGLLYGSLRKRNNLLTSEKAIVRFSIVISSIIFSAIHFQLLLFPALFVVGMLFASLYERKGRLAPAIWAHVGFNATTLFSLLVID